MQATGVYWIALYDVLEQHGIRVVLVNARHTKNVPGRKTDVQECQWLMKLHTYGLMRDSFRLQQDMEYLRTIWRVRDRHVKEAGQEVQHMQKALTKMNIQLANVISDISGVSGQAIVTAVLKGERDPYKLADLADYRVKASREEVARRLEGNWRADALVPFQPNLRPPVCPPVSLQTPGHLFPARLDPVVRQIRQFVRVSLALQNSSDDRLPADSADIADHGGQLNVPFGQRLLHVLHLLSGLLDVPVPHSPDCPQVFHVLL